MWMARRVSLALLSDGFNGATLHALFTIRHIGDAELVQLSEENEGGHLDEEDNEYSVVCKVGDEHSEVLSIDLRMK